MSDDTADVSGSIGSIISVNCGDAGYYQGRLKFISPATKSITLDRPLKDGVPIGHSVELFGNQIEGFKVLKTASEILQQQQRKPEPAPVAPLAPIAPVAPPSHSVQPVQQQPKHAIVLPLNSKPIDVSELEKDFIKPGRSPITSTPKSSEKKPKERRQQEMKKKMQSTSSATQWVSRPLRPRRNTTDGGNSPPTCSSARSSPTCDEDADDMSGIAPTPLFRKYDPQVPNPTILVTRPVRHPSKAKRNAGPSGIPHVDAMRGRITGRASELNRPLDLDLLDTDFDFEENLKLFNKEDADEDDFYETVEKPKMSANFAHYENIIDDPARCTSWTNIVSKHAYSEYESEAPEETVGKGRRSADVCSAPTSARKKKASPMSEARRQSSVSRRLVVSHFIDSMDGLRLPVLDEKEKARLAKESRAFLGDDAYSLILADRVLEWIFQVIASQAILVERVALLCADSTAQSLLDRILMQLTARGCRVSLFGATLEKALPLVELVASERDLPSDVQLIVDLDPSMQQKSRSAELTRWIADLAGAHVICLDHVCAHVHEQERVHALMVGALSTSVTHLIKTAAPKIVPKLGPTSVAELFGALSAAEEPARAHIGLADLGVPFAWFGEEAAAALSTLFATTFVAPCLLK